MTDELKPVRCGCGGETVVVEEPRDGYTSYYCTCLECAINTDYHSTEAEAIEAWNTAMGGLRSSDEVLRSSERTVKVKKRGSLTTWANCECGQAVSLGWSYCPFCGGKLVWK